MVFLSSATATARKHQPHALAFPFPAQGHINPMMHLCQRLVSMGFTITFVITVKKRSFINPLGNENFRFECLPDECLPQEKLTNNVQKYLKSMEGMKGDVEKLLRGLMEDSSRPPVTCIISDAFIPWTQGVARKFGICRISLWTCCATWNLLSNHLPLLQEKGLLPGNGSNKLMDFIPGFPAVSSKHLPPSIQEEDFYDPGFSYRIHRNTIMKDDAWTLVNSFYDLEMQPLDQLRKENPNCVPVGPLIPSAFIEEVVDNGCGTTTGLFKEDLSCLEWLDRQPPRCVLYISFGSLATLSVDQLKEISAGLERSEHAFLWVLRSDIVESEEFLSKMKLSKRGKIVAWAPQLKVLHHASVAAFLTHCGWNSLTETMLLGVPILGWPCIAEQSLNCALAVEHWKIGLNVSQNREEHQHIVSAIDVEKAVRGIMGEQGEELRKRVGELSVAARRSLLEGGSSYQNLQAFVEDMRKRAADCSASSSCTRN